MHRTDLIAIGDLAARTGVAVSAIRFYEAKGLIEALRTGGGQRRFLRADIRRVSFIRIAQQLGLSLEEIAGELAQLGHDGLDHGPLLLQRVHVAEQHVQLKGTDEHR